MLHLLAAKKLRPDGGAHFYIGSIAPDAVNGRHEKDISHFRGLKDRQSALVALAKETEGSFAEGVLLHLYFDWKWDTIVIDKYIKETGDNWFASYRNELSLSGSHAFHHTRWAKQLWSDMDAVNTSAYGTVSYASADDVKGFIARNNEWHNVNIKGPSPAFPPEFIDAFTTQTAEEFSIWLGLCKNRQKRGAKI